MSKRIGRYEIQTQVGRGGFGVVYRAFDPTMNRLVAIKQLTVQNDRDLLARFHNEAAAAGNLHHPNIVTIYDYGEEGGTPYLVMEYVEGEDLQKVIASGRPLPLLQKARIMLQVASGLECAHERGIVHRDVKPANIMLLPDGSVKIMDFGIALLTTDAGTRLTQSGMILGTVSYMSPEHFRNQKVTAQSDIFSYGAIYYELLTGKHPFYAAEAHSMMYNITLREPPSLQLAAPDVPDPLAAVVMRSLMKSPELRYQSFLDVLLDSRPILYSLQCEQAAALLADAKALPPEQQTEARRLLREALDLDPTNREARELRESLEVKARQDALRPRIAAAVQAADVHLGNRRYTHAAQELEAALQLDPAMEDIRTRLEEVRELLAQQAHVGELVQKAQSEIRNDNYTGAYRLLAQALLVDPESQEAVKLRNTVQQEMERRDQERRVRDHVARAQGLLDSHAFEQARLTIQELGSAAQSLPEVAALRNEIVARQAEAERQERYRTRLAEAESHLKQGQFEEAVVTLEALAKEHRRDDAVKQLLATARREGEEQRQREAVLQIANEANSASEAGELGKAVGILEKGLRSYPGDSDLTERLEAAIKTRAETERAANERRKAERQAAARTVVMPVPKQSSEASGLEQVAPERPRRSFLPWALAAGLAMALLVGIVAHSLMTRSTPPPQPRSQPPKSIEVQAAPARFSFAARPGKDTPPAQTLRITGTSAPVQVSSSAAWLKVFPVSVTPPADVQLTVDTSQLAAGTYSAWVSLSGSPALRVPVSLRLEADEERVRSYEPARPTGEPVRLSPPRLAFSAVEGGAAPASQDVRVTGGPSAFVVTGHPLWVRAVRNGDVVSVSVVPQGLAPASYIGSVRIARLDGVPVSGESEIGVVLSVTAKP